MKVFVVIDIERGVTVWYSRENAVKDTMTHFASMDIAVTLNGDAFMGIDDHGNELRWATIEECDIGDS